MRGVLFLVTTLIALLASASCDDSLSPLVLGTPYILSRINGDSVPWYADANKRIIEGWVTLNNDTLAERHEASTLVSGTTSWTVSGRYTARPGMLIVRYQRNPLEPGPLHAVDTFYVSGTGLTMREMGYPAPLDSMVRYYARAN
jgi:hypothetical protein